MNAPASGAASRVAAAGVLDAVLHRGRSLKAELATALPRIADTRDRALVEAVCFAALRRHARYDAALAAWMARPLPRKDAPLRALLHAGFAQIEALGLAPHAAVAATVEAARAMGRAHQAGLVNAMLRRAQREGLPEVDAAAAWPAWLRERLRTDWPDDFDAIVAASAAAAPLWLRVNRLRTDRDGYQRRLAEAGIAAEPHPLFADALRIGIPVAVAALPGFDDGCVSVQDASAQQVADALGPAPGARVLDACAAPGGKAAHLLERDPSLRVTALDIDPRRLDRIRATFARLGVGVVGVL
jgi:16S rRNA (cytosine967-C5)-methyltransferase